MKPLNNKAGSTDWIIRNLSIAGDISSFSVTACFLTDALLLGLSIGLKLLPTPLSDWLGSEDTFVVTVYAILHIDNQGKISSEVTDVSFDPENWYNWRDSDDALLSVSSG